MEPYKQRGTINSERCGIRHTTYGLRSPVRFPIGIALIESPAVLSIGATTAAAVVSAR